MSASSEINRVIVCSSQKSRDTGYSAFSGDEIPDMHHERPAYQPAAESGRYGVVVITRSINLDFPNVYCRPAIDGQS